MLGKIYQWASRVSNQILIEMYYLPIIGAIAQVWQRTRQAENTYGLLSPPHLANGTYGGAALYYNLLH